MLTLTHTRNSLSRYLKPGPRETLYLRIPRDLKERLETLATLEGMSLNEWLIRHLEETTHPNP